MEECPSTETFTAVFQRLIANAERNLDKQPQQVRHDIILKKFATSLFIYCGSRAYTFIHNNMPQALPSLRTVQRFVAKDYQPIHEGVFRFDELLNHLIAFKCPKIVSIGEDATRVIKKVQYDVESDKLVGFVLPCCDNGLPQSDAFIATDFESMQEFFSVSSVAKYAFVYMVKPLTDKVPAFCLSCIGTDNRFSAELVLKRWNYINSELKSRGIHLLSIGADGDSRELKAMQVSTQLLSSSPGSLSRMSLAANTIEIPSTWSSWFLLKRPTSIAFIQDPVHVAVKLKSRLLRPSIVLPLGKFAAGNHHLRIVQSAFSKDQHGLRERDVNHKDKQNYEAVTRMISNSVMEILMSIPDAKGTVVYLKIMKSITDTFLDKSLVCLVRVEKAWYCVVFLRYWRQWVLLCPEYNLSDNFITCNTYTCVELNAHSLIVYILSLQAVYASDSNSFLPWILGSQCCEKVFRSARSMSSVFSTVINFGMLGLLQRPHRLHVQGILESESEETEIRYPESHKRKEGYSNTVYHNVASISLEDISKSVDKALDDAKKSIDELGMSQLLKANDKWDKQPVFFLKENELVKEENDDHEEEVSESAVPEEEPSPEDSREVASGILKLSKAKIIDGNTAEYLNALHSASFKK